MYPFKEDFSLYISLPTIEPKKPLVDLDKNGKPIPILAKSLGQKIEIAQTLF